MNVNDIRSTLAIVSRDPGSFGRYYWSFRVRWSGGPSFEGVRAVADEMQETGISIRCHYEDEDTP